MYRLLRKSKRGRFTEAEVRVVLRQLAPVIAYLHGHGIMHRDLKLSNLLLTSGYTLRLCDFGLAVKLETALEEHHTLCGTPNYIAPEVLAGRRQPRSQTERPTKKRMRMKENHDENASGSGASGGECRRRNGHGLSADMWSVGVMVYTMLIGRPPFQGSEVSRTLQKVTRGTYSLPAVSRCAAHRKSSTQDCSNQQDPPLATRRATTVGVSRSSLRRNQHGSQAAAFQAPL